MAPAQIAELEPGNHDAPRTSDTPMEEPSSEEVGPNAHSTEQTARNQDAQHHQSPAQREQLGSKPNAEDRHTGADSELGSDHRKRHEKRSEADERIPSNMQLAEEAFRRGVEFRALGQYRKAIDEFSRAIKLNGLYQEAFYERAAAKVRIKGEADLQSALQDLKRAIELRDDFFEAYLEMGEALRMLADINKDNRDRGDQFRRYGQDSVDYYSIALQLEPGHRIALRGRGLAMHLLGVHGAALSDLSAALDPSELDADLLEERGNVRLAQTDYVGARDDFRAALGLDPHKTYLRKIIDECGRKIANSPSH